MKIKSLYIPKRIYRLLVDLMCKSPYISRITFIQNLKKSLEENEKPSIACYRPFIGDRLFSSVSFDFANNPVDFDFKLVCFVF